MRRKRLLGPKQRLYLKDIETGEECQLKDAHTVLSGFSRNAGDFCMCRGNELKDFLHRHDIKSFIALGLAMDMFTMAEIGTNYVRKTQQELAESAHTDRPNVSKFLKRFREIGLCIKIQNNVYFMNPNFAWKGTSIQRDKMIQEWEKRAMENMPND